MFTITVIHVPCVEDKQETTQWTRPTFRGELQTFDAQHSTFNLQRPTTSYGYTLVLPVNALITNTYMNQQLQLPASRDLAISF